MNHQGQFPSITLSFALAPGAALGEAVTAVQQAEDDIGMPANVHGGFAGTAQAFQKSLKSEPLLILAALLAVYIVLGMLYESYIHPITILSTLPSAGVGALLALLICGTDLTVIALIGIILLVGIVKKNAIMMIDFALDVQRKDGLLAKECDLPGVSFALPADLDDHPCSAPGRVTARARHGHRLGIAASARYHDCRRLNVEPDSYALHDAGSLPIFGSAAAVVWSVATG